MQPLSIIGILALVVGTLGGSLVAISNPEAVAWGPYVGFVGLSAAGVVVLRLQRRRAATDATALAGQMANVRSSAARLAELSADLRDQFRPDDSVYALPSRIDRELAEPAARFAEVREAIAEVHGIQAYAEVMGDFAAGERYLNRVWSAAAEGYVDEVETYLGKAARQFARTRDGIAELAAEGR